MDNPKVAMKLLGSDGQSTIKEEMAAIATDYVQKTKDSLNTLAKQEINKVKEQTDAAVNKLKDSINQIKEQTLQQAKEQVQNQLKQAVGIKDSGQGATGTPGLKGPKTVEEAKKELEKWNPFQKKKTGN
jgi:ElaB/YqjD/DUF883 family membrane-anchored ribosome-binding protein